ncbi:MAG: hypothetical protein GXP14_11580 [Gammaproteobacteria bacterium]|nr:hypothetical protein [Gammaproteobacteria bacterium]
MKSKKIHNTVTTFFLCIFSILAMTPTTNLMADDDEKKRDKDEKKHEKKNKKNDDKKKHDDDDDDDDDDKNRNKTIINLGAVQATPLANERGMSVSGRAMIIRHSDGKTTAYTQVLGLATTTSYGVHVHDLPCKLGGGGHYKNDPNVVGTEQYNEIELSFTTDNSGIGLGQGSGNFLARPEAQSVVIHDTDGGRIACADLPKNYKGATVHKGKMINFENGNVFGTAELSRANGSTFATLQVSGLATGTYPAHVHNLSCALNAGGTHYKIDPSNTETIEENEIFLTLTTDNAGNGSRTNVKETHLARPEAQSVVVHSGSTRLGCADLSAEESGKVKTQGTAITTAMGLSKGYDLTGTASMSRQDDGQTKVKVEIEGLSANMTYPTHVHNLPCKSGGGSHYKIDPAIAEIIESNEIWPEISTDKKGKAKGKAKVSHIARPEAQSIVIHDPVDSTRIGCFDLD